jgi:5'-nucleotidase / UDP-sugar diphosphatase
MAVAAYKSVYYDIAVLGNHEFDHGVDPVYSTIMQTTPALSWIGSNVRFTNAPYGLNISKALNTRGVCWVSALSQETYTTSRPGPNLIIDNVTSSIKSAISTGCNQTKNVIAVTHIGFDEDVALCYAVPELDLVIGGHSHTPLDQGQYPRKVVRPDGSVCWVIQTYAYGRVLGVLDVDFSANGTVLISGDAYIPMDGRIPLDPGTDRMVDYFRNQISYALKRVVGRATATIDGARANCRTKECQMGDLVCDALLAHAATKQGAQICITNGGGLRASIDAGDITVESVVTVLPFSNYHVVLQIPGSTIRSVLENGYSAVGNDAISGRFRQVEGMKVTANCAAPVGSRVISVSVGNAPLVASQMYTLSPTTSCGRAAMVTSGAAQQTSRRPARVWIPSSRTT